MKHLIKIALLLLASVAAYLVYGFTSSVAPLAVAALAAGSLVSTYIGLAFAEIPDTQQHNLLSAQHASACTMPTDAPPLNSIVLSLP